MRLQLTGALALLAVLLFTGAAHAQLAKVDTRAALYQDSDRTTITTSNTSARANPTEHFGVEARYLVDIITSASVDVVTAATGAFHELRQEGEGGLSYKSDNTKANASYIYSTEHDWQSHTGSAGFSQDLAGHNVTLNLGGSFTYNDVGRANDANFQRRLLVGGGSAGFTVVESPRSLWDLSYTLMYLSGYQASPYRFVFFRGEGGSPLTLSAPETDPGIRIRHAVTVRWNRHLFRDTALRSHARGYADDWGVVSATAGTEYVVGFGTLETALFVRGYAQRHASFYQPVYLAPARYMTADRELSTFVDGFGGARVGWRKARIGALEDMHLEARVTGFAFRFFDFPRLEQRTGVIGEVAMGVEF